MAILLPGGAGFIGSHTAVELLKEGKEIIIIDDFSNSTPKSIEAIKGICDEGFKRGDGQRFKDSYNINPSYKAIRPRFPHEIQRYS